MRVFCPTCRVVEGPSEDSSFDTTLLCKECSSPCKIPTIYECAQYGLLEELKFLQAEKAKAGSWDINALDEHNATLLHWASLNNRLLVMMHLLDFPDINVNVLGGDLLSTPIYWASHRNNIYAVALLLEHRADPTIADKNGVDAYFVAVQSGFTILSSYMIAMGCDVDTRCWDADQLTPLMWLCRYKFELDTARMLFGLGANIHLTDAHGNTALHLAATSDFAMAAKQLLDHGIDIYGKNKLGQTALDISNAVAATIEERTQGKRTAATVEFLRKVYRYDTSYNSLPLSVLKRNAQQTAFWTPWVVLGLAGYATHKLHGYWVLVGVLGSIAVGYFLFQVAGLSVNPGKRKNASLMLGVNVGSTFWISFVYLVLLRPLNNFSTASTMLLLFFLVGILGCLYFTTTRDPGFIPTSYEERRRNIRELVDMKSPSDVKLCTTCIQRRPLRSKHDAELNACIARFDHFCPFVANAVGANNHTVFFGFLIFAVAGIGWFLFLAYSYFNSEGIFNEASYLNMVTRLFHEYPVAMCTSILAVIHILWIGYLLGANIYGILFAWTTNECVLQGRIPVNPAEPTPHHSKFSRGVVQNVIDFFHLPLGDNRIDWTKARFYSLDDIHARRRDDKTE
ncbi:unnamed protein product [Aphanomyces euteiches]|uniref:Palmitoyltransferase n=1 Tax=Aphanomyces euteiches TaxID=100861 RepID=A0A6G0XXN9_9STRA|nr:hypothetical protein Ae201684_000507 [Aphanomyces euteiches]KAH9141101.1 hypothetical protein AeRB84_014700 [Aphanomyces euteiches]